MKKWIWIGVAIAAVVAVAVVGIIVISDLVQDAQSRAATEEREEQIAQVFEPVMPVCDGQRVTGTAPYRRGPGIHPIAVLRNQTGTSGWYAANDSYPDEWRPQALEEIELVACLQTQVALIESCPYQLRDGTEATIERYQYGTRVILVDPQSGRVIDDHVFAGTLPSECGDQVTFQEDELTKEYYGDMPTDEEIADWLQSYVERP